MHLYDIGFILREAIEIQRKIKYVSQAAIDYVLE